MAERPADASAADPPGQLDEPAVAEVRAAVLDWDAKQGRTLAFRRTRDPYRVLVLETMAQQTQIARAAERWAAFIERFPSFEALAAASPAEVVGAWRGLGYNRRAINLHRAARIVVAEHNGRLPSDLGTLARLPGVGPYTARAVAATAFGVAVGAVDTNVRRVLGRLVGGDTPPDPGRVQALADALVPVSDPAHWTHALMDLGATVCTPRTPRCDVCPLASRCVSARQHGGNLRGEPSRARQRAAVEPRFSTTSRWLRGRIVDRLRDAAGDGRGEDWTAFDEPIGVHSSDSVVAALEALARDGVVELRRGSRLEARLPTA